MATLQDQPAAAEDFTALFEAPGGWSHSFDPVAFGLTSGDDESEPDWWWEWFGDGSFPYDPATNNLTFWQKIVVPPGEFRSLFYSTEGSYWDTTIFVFKDDPVTALFDDLFTRSVSSPGLGGSYTDDGGSGGPYSVDGTRAKAGNGSTYGHFTGWNTSIPHPSDFELFFDLEIPAAGGTNTYLWITLGKLAIEVYPTASGSDPLTYSLAGYKSTGPGTSTSGFTDSFTLKAGKTYRFRVKQEGDEASMRFWALQSQFSDGIPGSKYHEDQSTWDYTWDLTGGYDDQFWLDFESGSSGTVQYLDNLRVHTIQLPWFDWDNQPPYPGNGRTMLYMDDNVAWNPDGVTPRKYNSLIDPDADLDGASDILPEGTYLICIGTYEGYGPGDYVLQASLTPWTPPPPPALVLKDSLHDAVDVYAALSGTPQSTGDTDVSAFTTDVNDPTALQLKPEMGAKGTRTGWLKVVLPSSGVLTIDAAGTTFKNALCVFEQAEDETLALVASHMKYATVVASEPTLTNRVFTPMTPGQGLTATGIPNVNHNDLMWRSYAMCEVDFGSGPSYSDAFGWPADVYGPGVFYGYPANGWGDILYFDVDVQVSSWNTGQFKAVNIKLQYWAGGNWYDLTGMQQSTGSIGDSRLGTTYHHVATYTMADAGFLSTGKFRIAIDENGWGSEIWTASAKLTVRAYWGTRHYVDDPDPEKYGARISQRFPAGTYLIALTQYLSDTAHTNAKVSVALTHPRL